jgi:5-methylcytosine-specific restriction enzyme subunit McrC
MNGTHVTLREWETLRPDYGTPLAHRTLDNDGARELAEQLSKAGVLEVLELGRGLEIRATSFIGRLRLGEITVTIQPKLSGAPFINLLRYAYDLRNLDLYKPVGYATEKWAFQDLLIQQLAAEVAELLARGVHREYERTRAELANPRGRIDFDRFVGMAHQSRAVLPCAYHPRTEDTLLNQVVLAGLVHARYFVVNPDLRAHLVRLAKTLSADVSFRQLSMTSLGAARQTVDRRTIAYIPALMIIHLLLRTEGMSLDGEETRLQLPGFLFDMNRFFQALISRFLHDHLEGCEIQDEYWLRDLFSYNPELNPRRRRAPTQRPDFLIRHNRQITAILDAKYRDLWETSLPREMLYQLALYALGQTGDKRKAVILYPTLTGEASDQAIYLHDPSTGVPQAQVILRPINLLELESLLRSSDKESGRRKVNLAHQLSFGTRYYSA